LGLFEYLLNSQTGRERKHRKRGGKRGEHAGKPGFRNFSVTRAELEGEGKERGIAGGRGKGGEKVPDQFTRYLNHSLE